MAGSRPAASSAPRTFARRVRRSSAVSGKPVPGAVPLVGVLRHEAEHPRLLAGDQDRRAAWADRAWQQLDVLGAVVSALEAHSLAAEERREDLEPLLEAADAVVERVAEGVELGLVPSAAEAEDQATIAHLVELDRHLRGERRVAEREREHERADLDARRHRRDGGQDGPRLVDAGRLAVHRE